MKIVSDGLASLSECVETSLSEYDRKEEQYQMEIEKLERQVRLLEGKNRSLEQEYSYAVLMNNQFKQKLQ